MTINPLVQTGRTTRMLKEARGLAEEGNPVCVVFHTLDVAKQQKHSFMKTLPAKHKKDLLGIKFESPSSLGNFNWMTLTVPGMHPAVILLIDHAVLEMQFAKHHRMMHQFDEDVCFSKAEEMKTIEDNPPF